MNSNKNNRKLISILWSSLILCAVFFSFMKISGTDFIWGNQWAKYYSIITSDASTVEAFFLKENIPLISFNRSEVVYNDISDIKKIPLKAVVNHFDPHDPRYDPYLKKVGTLFTAHKGDSHFDIVYADRESISLFGLYIKMFRYFSKSTVFWTISGFEPVFTFLPLLILIIFYGGFILISSEKKILISIILLSWLPFVLLYGFSALAVSVVSLYIFARKKSLFLLIPFCIITLLYAHYSLNLSRQYLLLFALGLFSLLLLYYDKLEIKGESPGRDRSVLSGKRKIRRILLRKPEHNLFSPVLIMGSQYRTDRVGVISKSFFVVFLLIVSGFSLIDIESSDFIVPFAQEQSELGWTLENTGLTEDSDSLLSASDYITHVAYQKGLLYGSEWSYPKADRPLLYPVFKSTDEGFIKEYVLKADYSDKWFRETILQLNNNNPATLLFSTETPCFVIKTPVHRKNKTFMLHNFTFSMLLLLLIIFSDGKQYNRIPFNVRKKLLRRNEQVA
ncbi:MAG: hypothetical protein JEY91_04865 [Spirochaetaceae bacterium]|nr:hypothetical protein [Spirochaetaceae bacterium]